MHQIQVRDYPEDSQIQITKDDNQDSEFYNKADCAVDSEDDYIIITYTDPSTGVEEEVLKELTTHFIEPAQTSTRDMVENLQGYLNTAIAPTSATEETIADIAEDVGEIKDDVDYSRKELSLLSEILMELKAIKLHLSILTEVEFDGSE